jgi:predicted RNA-binding Zn-ribbon protein involved in translation (DUF1610 family)
MRAVSITCSVFAGYVIGTLLILVVLSSVVDVRESLITPSEIFIGNMLTWRYRFDGFDVPYGDTGHYSILSSLLSLLLFALGTRWFIQRSGFIFAPGMLRQHAESDRARRAWVWRSAVDRAQSTRSWRFFTSMFLTSVFGVGLGFASDCVVNGVRDQLFMRNPAAYSPAFISTPVPVIGWYTISDLVWIVAFVLIAEVLVVVRRARSCVRDSRVFRKCWCASCGYPIMNRDRSASACPECGSEIQYPPSTR